MKLYTAKLAILLAVVITSHAQKEATRKSSDDLNSAASGSVLGYGGYNTLGYNPLGYGLGYGGLDYINGGLGYRNTLGYNNFGYPGLGYGYGNGYSGGYYGSLGYNGGYGK